jgi:hypothetical protein
MTRRNEGAIRNAVDVLPDRWISHSCSQPGPQPAAPSARASARTSVVVPADLTVISSPFLFMSNLCFRSKPLTNSRVALATAPGRLDASTFAVDSSVISFRSR